MATDFHDEKLGASAHKTVLMMNLFVFEFLLFFRLHVADPKMPRTNWGTIENHLWLLNLCSWHGNLFEILNNF